MRNATVSDQSVGRQAAYLPSRRPVAVAAGMLEKQEVCLPSATPLIVFIALSIPQAALIPQIPLNAAKLEIGSF